MPVKLIRDFDDPDRLLKVQYVPDHAGRTGRPNPVRPAGYPRRGAPSSLAPQRQFIVGLDLGQAADYTAAVAVERVSAGYVVPFIARTRGKPYPEIVASVADLMRRPPLAGASQLVVDMTGCGRPVFDLLNDASLDPVGISITGGDKPSGGRRLMRVPKRDLVSALLVAFQAGTIRISANVEHASTLMAELADMRRKITAAGHDTYGAWRDGSHDDLVLALAMAVWYAEKFPKPMVARAPAASPDGSTTQRRLVPPRARHVMLTPDRALERIETRTNALGSKRITGGADPVD